LLKWDYQQGKRSKSWALSVREQRHRVEAQLRDNPGLKPRLADTIRLAYDLARERATRETKLDPETFSEGESCVRGDRESFHDRASSAKIRGERGLPCDQRAGLLAPTGHKGFPGIIV